MCGRHEVQTENAKYNVRIVYGGKRAEARGPLSSVLFNLDLKMVVRILLDNGSGLSIKHNKIPLLGFADDLNILSESLVNTAYVTRKLEKIAKKIGLEIKTEKTNIIKLIKSMEKRTLSMKKLAILNI